MAEADAFISNPRDSSLRGRHTGYITVQAEELQDLKTSVTYLSLYLPPASSSPHSVLLGCSSPDAIWTRRTSSASQVE